MPCKGLPSYAWDNVSYNGGVYAIPQDSGVYALLYNATLMKKYGLAVPTTWAQMITEARRYRRLTGVYINDFAPTIRSTCSRDDAGRGQDFVLNGTKLSVGFTSMAQSSTPRSGTRCCPSVWLPRCRTSARSGSMTFKMGKSSRSWLKPGSQLHRVVVGQDARDWRVAPLPQFVAGQNIGMNGGGSPEAVTSQTKYPSRPRSSISGSTRPRRLSACWTSRRRVVPDGDDGQRVRCVPQPEAAAHGSQELYRVTRTPGRPWVRFRLRPVCQLRRQRAGNAMDLVAQGRETVSKCSLPCRASSFHTRSNKALPLLVRDH